MLVILKCLEKAGNRRYQQVEEFEDKLSGNDEEEQEKEEDSDDINLEEEDLEDDSS